jgi:hypothetical protein
VVELASTISKHLKTVSETLLSCDQSTWMVKGLQQIHAAGYEAHRHAFNQGSPSLPAMTPIQGANRSWSYTAADHGTARPGSIVFVGWTSFCGTGWATHQRLG